MKIQDLREAKTVNDVSEYVQNNAKFYRDAPKNKYAVKHPTQYGGASVFSNDTWVLVVNLCDLYGIKLKKGERGAGIPKMEPLNFRPPKNADEYYIERVNR